MNNLFHRSDSDGETGSWNRWSHFVLNEVKRTATSFEKLESEIKDIAKDVGNVRNQLIQVAASPHLEVIQTEIQNIKSDISEIKQFVEDCKKFKTETKLLFAVSGFLFSAGLTLLGIFLK